MKKSKIVAGIVWILLAVYVCLEAFKLDIGTLTNPEPGFMPFICGVLIGLLGAVVVVAEWKNQKKVSVWGATSWGKIAAIILGIIAFALVVERMGYLLSLFFLMALFFKVLGSRNWMLVILYSFLSTLTIYLIFDVGLQVQFPRGILRI